MSKEEILDYFKDINAVYNDCTKYDTLKRMLDELQDPLADATKYFNAIYKLSQTLDVSYDFIDEKIKEMVPAFKKPSISDDGTLTVYVEDGKKVSRVLVCGDNHFGGLYYPEYEPCTDAISRQEAIDAIFAEPLYKPGMKKRYAEEVVPAIFEKIKLLPPVTPAEKVGRWIEHETDDGRSWLECPICHIKKQYPITNYCPKCGSRNTEKDIHGEDKWVW